jgi:type VI secretion system protein ImpA
VSARSGETVLTKEQVVQMLAGAIQAGLPLRADMQGALDQVRALTAVCAARLGVQHAPDLRLFQTLLVNTMALLPPAPAAEPEGGAAAAAVADASIAASAPAAAPRPAQGLSGKVTSREEAVRAIDMVCEYLDTAEPSNPAQLLLRRSRRLINQNFLQLMKEFAPGAMADVARMMGVDPESVKIDKTP